MKVTPLGDRVLLKIAPEESTTKGGIIIPDTAREKTQTGTVVSIGDSSDIKQVKVGNKVIYDKYAGSQIEIDSVEHLVIAFKDILAIVE